MPQRLQNKGSHVGTLALHGGLNMTSPTPLYPLRTADMHVRRCFAPILNRRRGACSSCGVYGTLFVTLFVFCIINCVGKPIYEPSWLAGGKAKYSDVSVFSLSNKKSPFPLPQRVEKDSVPYALGPDVLRMVLRWM